VIEGSKWAERWRVLEEPRRDVGQFLGGVRGRSWVGLG